MDFMTLAHVTDRIATISRLAQDSDEFCSLIDILLMELSDEMDRQEALMIEEMFMQDSDGSACLGIQIGEAA